MRKARHSRRCWLLVILVLSVGLSGSRPLDSGHAHAADETAEYCTPIDPTLTTWFPKEFECPICKTKNIFMVWGSYGSYIYQWPSKYQLVFWPYTEAAAWYSCRKCRLTVFMGDFEKIPPEKIPDLRKALETTTLPPQPERSAKDSLEKPPYLDVPMPARLAVAETVYRTLGKTDDEFWNHFYLIVVYHS